MTIPKPKYYIRILPWMRPYVEKRGVASPDWQHIVFNDITWNGTELRAHGLPQNEHGPLISLRGKHFVCQAGVDKSRSGPPTESDSLFLSKVERIDSAIAPPSLCNFPASFELLSDKSNPASKGQPVMPIFLTFKRQPHPSPELIQVLRGVSSEVLALWRPSTTDDPPSSSFLEEVTVMWRQFRLERYADPLSARLQMLLTGRVRPVELGSSDLELIRNALGVSTLDRMASYGPERSELPKFLARLPQICIGSDLRATIFTSMLTGLDGLGLRRELRASCVPLRLLNATAQAVWAPLITEAIRCAGLLYLDEPLLTLAGSLEFATDPIAELQEWTSRLEFVASSVSLSDDALPKSLPQPEPPETAGSTERLPAPKPAAPLQVAPMVPPQLAGVPLHGGAPVIERWGLGLRVDTVDDYLHISEAIEQELWTWLELPRSVSSYSGVVDFLNSLSRLQGTLARQIQTLPNTESLAMDFNEANLAYHAAVRSFGEAATERTLATPKFRPAEVHELAEELNSEVLRQLPEWLFRLESTPQQDVLDVRLGALRDPEIRHQVVDVAAFLTSLSKEESALCGEVPPPSEDIDVVDYFIEACRSQVSAYRAVAEMGPEHRHWVELGRSEGTPVPQLLALRSRIDDLFESMGEASAAEVAHRIKMFKDYAQVDLFVRDVESCVEASRNTFPDLTKIPFEVLLTAQVSAGASKTSGASTRRVVKIEHNFVDSKGERVMPLWVPDEAGSNFGQLKMPLVVRTQQPSDLNLQLSATMRGKLREAWPSGRADITPESMSVSISQWRRDNEGFMYTFELCVPCRHPQDRQRLDISLELSDEAGNYLGEKRRLEWIIGGVWHEPVSFAWPDVVEPELVRESPIGPQNKYKSMMEQLQSGGSVAIAIPRRFGKTTLVKYIHQNASDHNLLIPAPVSCTTHQNRGKFNGRAFWEAISQSLQAATGCRLLPNELSSGLPHPRAFDDARRAAAKKGCTALVIVVDEAQLLFPRSSFGELGHRMKDRLEHEWATKGQTDMVPLAFCLIGLTSLLERVGANFEATLWTYSDPQIHERDLQGLIAQKTSRRLRTTRELRTELSRRATNLYVLKTLLRRLVDHANEQERNWVAYQDLEEVERVLIDDLRAGQEPGVVRFIRDALNKAEDVNDWQSVPAYAVAVAIASMRGLDFRQDNTQARISKRLNKWCSKLSAGESYAKVVYSSAQVKAHIEELLELRVLNGQGFTSPLVSAWLRGISETFPSDESERNALLSGALRRIRIPEVMEPVGGGSEAQIYRFVENGQHLALRKVLLRTEEQRRRFAERAETLEVVRQCVDAREDGSRFIYNLSAVGLASQDYGREDDADDVGVEIYRWVGGEPLGKWRNMLGEVILTEVGLMLSRALVLLHRNGVMHRDISPENIILTESGTRPILIDFGLARLERLGFSTRLSGKYSAPEVCTATPRWTTKADIFGLGASLRVAAKKKVSGPFGHLLELCMSQDLERRPEGPDLVERLEEFSRDLKIEEKKNRHWLHIKGTAAADATNKSWYWRVLEKFRYSFTMLGIGLHVTSIHRCREVAAFLDQVLEASSPNPRVQKRSLGQAKHHERILDTPEIELAHALRLDRSHAEGDQQLRRLMRDKKLVDADLPAGVAVAALQIQEFLGLTSLHDTAKVVLGVVLTV